MIPPSRRTILKATAATAAATLLPTPSFARQTRRTLKPSNRPPKSARKFVSGPIEDLIAETQSAIADAELAWMFGNCFPNTIDTTVTFNEGAAGGEPDTYVITGDIDAMWLRDSSAQVQPYVPHAGRDPRLKAMLAGVIRRQARCILLDPYANAFYDDPHRISEWHTDYTDMRPGVHERKWEIDSLCYPIRLADTYWKATGDASPFDATFRGALDAILRTFTEQTRPNDNPGPYRFKRDEKPGGARPAPDAPELLGPPVKPVGLICSRFRPSDDPTTYQFLIPSNWFAAATLQRMWDFYVKIYKDYPSAQKCEALMRQVLLALEAHGTIDQPNIGHAFAYEVDGLGHVSVMDDANVPNLMSLPYLTTLPFTDARYQASRRMGWSTANPWFFRGRFEGVGGPHIGPRFIWPMGHIMRILTSGDETEVVACLRTLRDTHAGTGFIHESFHIDDPSNFTRKWFAWANTLFGEMILHVRTRWPGILEKPL